MRLPELARLKLTDIELPTKISKELGNVGSATILGKGRRTRTITLNWRACKAIKAYLAVRPTAKGDPPLPNQVQARHRSALDRARRCQVSELRF
jgi:site-specific recombinase XerD